MKRLFAFEIVAVIYTDQFLNCTMKKELKPEIRAYIKGRAALKIPPRNVYKKLTDIYGYSTVSFMTVSGWMKKFKTGIYNIKGGHRVGRPKTSVTKNHAAAVKALIDEDGRYTVEDIAKSIGISEGNVHEILTKTLGLRKICARWVPDLLIDEQKQERLKCSNNLLKQFRNCDNRKFSDMLTGDETWVYMLEPQRKADNKQWRSKTQTRPVVCKRQKSAKKVMYTIFFNSCGPVVQIPSETGKSITGKFYKDVVLKKVKKFYKKKRPSVGLKGTFLLHDNAQTQKCNVVVDFLDKEKVKVIKHPPFSPDLSPCDFFLFPRLKKMPSGRKYHTKSA